jgi:peptidoglycan/LPS O-acetylase OafA/YrhL
LNRNGLRERLTWNQKLGRNDGHMTAVRDTADLVHAADPAMARARAAAMPMAAQVARYRPDIDGLRAVAVVSVIVYHAFPSVLPGGYLGVDVFFVISGYLITQLILKDVDEHRFSVVEFYRRRARRILPALLVVLAASALFGWFALTAEELSWLGRSIAWSALFMANVFFARAGEFGGYFDPGSVLTPLIHLWSLGVEEQFYLAWPVLLLLAGRARVIRPTLLAVIVISLALSFWGGWVRPEQSFYLPTSRAWELASGGILAALRTGGSVPAVPLRLGRYRIGTTDAMSAVGLALIFLGARFVTSAPPLSELWGLTPPLGAALLIAAGSQAPTNRYLLASRPTVFVGRISYPLYLWHWPALSFTRIVIGRPLTHAEAATAVLIAALAAYATCRLVEEPIRFGSIKQRAVPVLLWALAAMAILGMGLDRGWVTGRLSNPAFRAWEAAAVDWNFPAGPKKNHLGTIAATSQRGKTALFIGDSHVQQYWPRARLIVDTHPRSARSALFATYTGCPPLPDIDAWHRGSDCSSAFKNAVAMAFHNDVDTVVFGAAWEDYFMGEFSGQRRPMWGTLGVYSHGDPLRRRLTLDSPGTKRALEDFGRTISRLTASGRRVFILLSNPTSPHFDPVYLLPTAARLSLRLPDRINVGDEKRTVDARPFESYVAPLMSRLRQVAATSGAIVLDPREALCTGMTCPATNARGMPVHIDSNHLTAAFAREHATFIDGILLAPAASGRAP